jgi:hypothetical protein
VKVHKSSDVDGERKEEYERWTDGRLYTLPRPTLTHQ